MSAKVAESASSRASIRDPVERDFLLAFLLHSYHSTLSLVLSPSRFSSSSSVFAFASASPSALSIRYIIFSSNSIIGRVITRDIRSREKNLRNSDKKNFER